MAVAAVAGLAAGAAAGALNGAAAACARIPDFVVTLAGMVVYRGLAQLVGQNRVVSGLPDGYRWLGEGTLLGFLPVSWLFLLAAWGAGHVLLHRSRLGRYAFAIGASAAAARAAGVPVRRTRVILYALSGFAAGLSAIIYTARFDTARSDAAEGLELDVIACVLLGGASISGGRGTLAGTILGVLVVGCLRTGLVLLGVPELYRRIAVGAILVVAAAWNELLLARSGRA
jgi:ribose/xylose/arabinose/galactoside ABC-type transport system permease subunit